MSSNTSNADSLTQDSKSSATPSTGSDDKDVVRLSSGFDADGTPSARAVLTPDSDQSCKEIHCDPRPSIPVIFLPGVMGSLLANKNTGESVWYPPNMDSVLSSIPGVISVIAGWFAGAAKRETGFDPEQAVVDPRGPVKVGDSGLSEEEAKRRGWNTVHRWSYQPTLAWLEYALNHPVLGREPHGEWVHGDAEGQKAALKAVLGTDPADYGGHGSGGTITADSDVFKSLVRYRYQVYAIGYNFLQSNEKSGQQVLDGMDFKDPDTKQVTRIMGIREICRENNTDKAIIITHSMGGLVARMASQMCGGADSMYGVIHGAQPATGAPLFAKRFRTGGEGNGFKEVLTNQSLLGRNDAEFVAIAGNAEGPMELSPMPDYNNGEPWWIFVDQAGNKRMTLPHQSALDELYVNDKWYGLLPDPSLLDPAGIVKKRLEKEQRHISVDQNFRQMMRAVVDRQKVLINNYHPNTYAMYGDGALRQQTSDSTPATHKLEVSEPEEKLQTWGTVVWQGDIPEGVDEKALKAAEWVGDHRDDHHGVLQIKVGGQTVKLTVQQKAVAAKSAQKYNDIGSVDGVVPKETANGIIRGDGTVPAWSAAAQGRGLIPGLTDKAEGMQMVFVQGGYEHQFCFDHPRSRWATLYSLAQIAHSIKATVP